MQGANILDPSLNIVGRSTVSDYDVRARIFGNVSNPTVILDSSPPLAQGDILVCWLPARPPRTLRRIPRCWPDELPSSYWNRFSESSSPTPIAPINKRNPSSIVFRSMSLPGNRAGEQDIVSSFKLTKNWEIIGDFGTSSYQGRLKYLVRFR